MVLVVGKGTTLVEKFVLMAYNPVAHFQDSEGVTGPSCSVNCFQIKKKEKSSQAFIFSLPPF